MEQMRAVLLGLAYASGRIFLKEYPGSFRGEEPYPALQSFEFYQRTLQRRCFSPGE
jgi:hypothetical protein